MFKHDLQDLFVITIIIVLFFEVWNVTYGLICPISLIIPLLVLMILGISFYGIKIQQRECFRECFFESKSFISKVLSNKFSIIVLYTLFAIIMSLSTIYLMLQYTHEVTKYLIVYIIFLYSFYRIIIGLLRGTARDKFLLLFAKEITMKITSFLAIVGYAYILLKQTLPQYLSTDFLETVRNASNTVESKCVVTDFILRSQIEIDSSVFWLVNNVTNQTDNHLIIASIWFTLVVINSLAIISINRLMLEIMYLKLKGRFE